MSIWESYQEWRERRRAEKLDDEERLRAHWERMSGRADVTLLSRITVLEHNSRNLLARMAAAEQAISERDRYITGLWDEIAELQRALDDCHEG